MTQAFQDSDLLALRDAVAQLARAVTAGDLALVEASTAQIKLLIDQASAVAPLTRESQLALIQALDASSQEIEAVLASRLRAFDIAIAAWREPDPGH